MMGTPLRKTGDFVKSILRVNIHPQHQSSACEGNKKAPVEEKVFAGAIVALIVLPVVSNECGRNPTQQ